MKNPLFLILFLSILNFTFVACGDDESSGPDDTSQTEAIVPGSGITSIKIGDTGQKVFDEFGEVADSYGGANGSFVHFLWYMDKGMTFYLEANDSETLDLSKLVEEIHLDSPFSGETADGLKVGSTKAEVKAIYGEPDNSSAFFGDDYVDERITFEYDDNEVVEKIVLF